MKINIILIPFLIQMGFFWSSKSSPITNPLKENGDINSIIPEYLESKKFRTFHNSTPIVVSNIHTVDTTVDKKWEVDFRIRWQSSVGSSVYATPVIFPAGADGKKSIFLSTFYQFIEVLGYNGFKPWGWPISFEGSTFQGSPMLYDIDADGATDIGVVDKNANLFWIRLGEYGQYLEDYHTQVPKLKVKRDWADGLDPKFTDSYIMLSMFDHNGDYLDQDGSSGMTRKRRAVTDKLGAPLSASVSQKTYNGVKKSGGASKGVSGAEQPAAVRRRLTEAAPAAEEAVVDAPPALTEKAPVGRDGKGEVVVSEAPGPSDSAVKGATAADAAAKGDVLASAPEDKGDGKAVAAEDKGAAGREENLHAAVEDDHAVLGQLHHMREDSEGGEKEEGELPEALLDDIAGAREYMYEGRPGGGARGHMLDDIHPYYFGIQNDSAFVFVDPHVLGSPVLADVNNDGHIEVVMAVSYYFDKADYAGKNIDFDPSKYVAGGVAVWDMEAQDWSWMVHLDLTTDKTRFKALIHASPTVADLDGDGRHEVIVGTSLGLLYVLDGDSGYVRRFFPMQFHEIQAQVAVADVVGGSNLEMILGDMGGNLVCVSLDGDVLWDVQLSGAIPFTPTVGDCDGDGHMDVVVSTVDKDGKGSHIWAVNGATGRPLTGYPINLPHSAGLSSPLLLVDLHDYSSAKSDAVSPVKYADPNIPPWMQLHRGHEPAPAPSMQRKELEDHLEGVHDGNSTAAARGRKQHVKHLFNEAREKSLGLHMVAASYDGHIYVIDAVRRTAQRVDVGEHVYSVPLVDDVTGDGFLDLVVGTISGQVLVLETSVPAHPLNAWPSFPKGRFNGFVHGQIGISIPALEKERLAHTDISHGVGAHRRIEADAGEGQLSLTFDIWDGRKRSHDEKYTVTVSRGSNKKEPLLAKEYKGPGRYTILLPLHPPERTLLLVSMVNEHGQYFEDSVEVAVGTRFYVWIKYFVTAPVIMLCVPLLLMRPVAPNK